MHTKKTKETVEEREGIIVEYLERKKYATVSEVWDALPARHRGISAGALYSHMAKMVKNKTISKKKMPGRINLYYLPTTEPPTKDRMPEITRDFHIGAYSRHSKYNEYYGNKERR